MTLSLVDIVVWDVICVCDSWCYIDLNWLNWVFMTLVRVLVYDLDGIYWFRCFYDVFFIDIEKHVWYNGCDGNWFLKNNLICWSLEIVTIV